LENVATTGIECVFEVVVHSEKLRDLYRIHAGEIAEIEVSPYPRLDILQRSPR